MALKELQAEYDNVAGGAGKAWVETGVLLVTGADRVKWLHKLVTADVEHLAMGQGIRGALLEAKGHFLADFVLLVLEESVLLLVEPTARETFLNELRRYIFREKVKVTDESDRWRLWTVVGAKSDAAIQRTLGQTAPTAPFHWSAAEVKGARCYFFHRPRAPFPATDVLVPVEVAPELNPILGLPECSPELLEVMRVEAGLPRWGTDFDSTTLALEIPDVMSIRVDQGCYVGQEVVARLVHRGHVNRNLVGLRLDTRVVPAPGQAILQQEKEVGSITSAVDSPRLGVIGLGYVRREAATPGTELRVGDAVAHVVDLPLKD